MNILEHHRLYVKLYMILGLFLLNSRYYYVLEFILSVRTDISLNTVTEKIITNIFLSITQLIKSNWEFLSAVEIWKSCFVLAKAIKRKREGNAVITRMASWEFSHDDMHFRLTIWSAWSRGLCELFAGRSSDGGHISMDICRGNERRNSPRTPHTHNSR